jgi:hypothetical protein
MALAKMTKDKMKIMMDARPKIAMIRRNTIWAQNPAAKLTANR